MKIVEIWKDEAYPVFVMAEQEKSSWSTTEVPDELLEEYEKVEEIYSAFQKKLKAIYETPKDDEEND